MNLLVIGHSVLDTIIIEGKEALSPGGIFYTVSQLGLIKETDDKIDLCTTLSDEGKHLFSSAYKNVSEKFIEKSDSILNVKLLLDKNIERTEIYNTKPSPLNTDSLNPSNYDGILINMITGNDLTIDKLINLKKKSKAIIYFDVHSLSRPLNNHMHREFRKIPDFENWAKNIDLIQSNEYELHSLFNYEQEDDIIQNLFRLGVKVVLLTKGKLGAKAFYKYGDEISSAFVASRQINIINTVGSGDIFGASFFYNYIRTQNVAQSLHFAVNNAENFLINKANPANDI